MNNRHRVFVSYYHEQDQFYRERFELMFSDIYNILESKSVEIGDIDPYLKTETIHQKIRDVYLRDSTVTVVLVGAKTWQRKFVDWEINSSIRDTKYNSRSGLLGILLPTYPPARPAWERLFTGDTLPAHQITQNIRYNPHTIPPRLYDNLACGFATIHNWSENSSMVQSWIDKAFKRRLNKTILPNNARPLFKNNRTAERWLQ